MPWRVPKALDKARSHKQQAESSPDPFEKLFQFEEACKLFNRVLEIQTDSHEARSEYNDCVARMNAHYKRIKSIKRESKMMNPELSFSRPGDFLRGSKVWVRESRNRPESFG